MSAIMVIIRPKKAPQPIIQKAQRERLADSRFLPVTEGNRCWADPNESGTRTSQMTISTRVEDIPVNSGL